MKLGVLCGFGAHATPEAVADTARRCERAGVHSFWAPEHAVFFREHASRYPYSADGRIPGNPDSVLDPFLALTWAAAHTERIRLGTGVCLVPQRQPVYTAKQVADLDWLSGGRFDFGVGTGWCREEFEALGVPWPQRGERTLECLELMRSLWCDELSSHAGERYSLPECVQGPKPVQKPHPPIYFGGESDPALERVARAGQGWFGFDVDPERLEERLGFLDARLADAGRSRSDIRVFVSPYRRRPERKLFEAYGALGVDQLIVTPPLHDADRFTAFVDAAVELAGA